MLHQLIHKGVIIPDAPAYHGLAIKIDGKIVQLTPKQEEMAYAWAKKKGTPYADDLVFIRNFMHDFSKALGYEMPLRINQIDFAEVDKRVEDEKAARETLSKEEKKALALERKMQRDERKQEYGYAVADGERIELGNYMTEPSGIFMGRGKHPLRGRWKEGAVKSDVTLNLSPDADIDRQEWKEVIWQPESLWVARWEDKLSGKQKYIWLHDSAPIKQSREAQKFDKAIELNERLALVREHIDLGLMSDNAKTRRIATACSLIDELCLRVGDEKDPDEADTVGATTLRPEHVKIHPDAVVEFRFLGKDSVLWHKKIALPQHVITNLQELLENAKPSSGRSAKKHSVYNKPQLFPDISSRNVNEFLSQVMPGLTAKVFRTHHASQVVRDSLDAAAISPDDPEYKKWEAATQANTQAAILCNHTKQAPKNWGEHKKRYKEREKRAADRVKKVQERSRELKSTLSHVKKEFAEKKKVYRGAQAKKLAERYRKKINALKARIENSSGREERAQAALGKLRAQMAIAMENRTWNLGTSQKSYIDPRIFYNWGNRVDYDVLEKYYSKTLRVKFQWVKNDELNADAVE